MKYTLSDKIQIPKGGEKITYEEGKLNVPDMPIVPYIEGDGIGPDIWKASQPVFDAAVKKAYKDKRKVMWMEVYAGEKAYTVYKNIFPEDVLIALKDYMVSIKGPLTTPVGGGHRSLNVSIRQELDLYACVRPVKYYKNVIAPVKHPENVDVVIFRENVEDVYAGIEWEAKSKDCLHLIHHINDTYKLSIPEDSGIGIKPISKKNTSRLVRKGIEFAIENKRRSVTFMHKGNIMKYTEGAFKDWGYEVAKREFGDFIVTEKDLYDKYEGKVPEGKVIIKDRIADNLFQQLLLHPEEYDVVCAPNLNGDYLSDFLAAQVGGLGLAPGANIGDGVAVFEATHGSAPKYTNKNLMNPSSLILSGVMMFEYMGWIEAAKIIEDALSKTIIQNKVTKDLAKGREDKVTNLGTYEFGQAIIENM
jgi:isocitrate dehydrogenase